MTGQVVAVFGSVRVHGKVGDQVVAVMGSVLLGPDAVVGGDVVSVGGRVYREGGAETRGGVTEVALDDCRSACTSARGIPGVMCRGSRRSAPSRGFSGRRSGCRCCCSLPASR